MDAKELICKCKAITLKEEEADKIRFVGKMKKKWEKLTTRCLIGKILLTREVTIEMLRLAM